MAYPYLVLLGKEACEEAQMPPPFGPGLHPAAAREVQALLIQCSSFADAGEDWTRFIALGWGLRVLADVHVNGY